MNIIKCISLYFKKRKPVVRPLIRKTFNFTPKEKIRTARKVNSFFHSRAPSYPKIIKQEISFNY